MRITVSSARTALAQDMQTMREKEAELERTINMLNEGIDETMLISESYLATADLISRVLLPTAYSIHRQLRGRYESGQKYESALNALSSMDIWDMDEILRSQEDAARVYQTVCDIRDRNTDPNEYEFLCELCEAERQKLQYWESKKNLFETFLSNTSILYNGYATDIVPLYNAFRNTRFEYDAQSGEWNIDGLSVDAYLGLNGSTIDKEAVVNEFELINPNLAKRVQELYGQTLHRVSETVQESEIYTKEEWIEFRYLLYTAPAKVRNNYISNVQNINDIRDGARGVGAYYTPNKKEITIDVDDRNDNTILFMHTLFHEMGHAIDYSASDSQDALTSEDDVEMAYCKDVRKNFYRIVLETIERRANAAPEQAEKPEGTAARVWDALMQKADMSNEQKAETYTRIVMQAHKTQEAKNLAERLMNWDPCFNEAVTTYKEPYFDNHAASDISGAATGNFLRSNWGHGESYWDDSEVSRANKEGFASYLSAIVIRDYKSVRQIQTDFPHSAELYENAIQEGFANLNPVTSMYRE